MFGILITEEALNAYRRGTIFKVNRIGKSYQKTEVCYFSRPDRKGEFQATQGQYLNHFKLYHSVIPTAWAKLRLSCMS